MHAAGIKKKNWKNFSPAEVFGFFCSSFIVKEDDRSLSLAVMELPDRYKQVVLLYYFQGMTQRETAAALGLSPAAVLRRLRSAEALLKEALTGGEEA